MKYIWGLKSKIIFRIKRKMPIVTKQKITTARPNKNLKKPSIYLVNKDPIAVT